MLDFLNFTRITPLREASCVNCYLIKRGKISFITGLLRFTHPPKERYYPELPQLYTTLYSIYRLYIKRHRYDSVFPRSVNSPALLAIPQPSGNLEIHLIFIKWFTYYGHFWICNINPINCQMQLEIIIIRRINILLLL
jgi:hypothetical protein